MTGFSALTSSGAAGFGDVMLPAFSLTMPWLLTNAAVRALIARLLMALGWPRAALWNALGVAA